MPPHAKDDTQRAIWETLQQMIAELWRSAACRQPAWRQGWRLELLDPCVELCYRFGQLGPHHGRRILKQIDV